MKKTDYTFIIPAYNCSKTVVNCLDSIVDDIIDSSIPNNLFEIIVVENGSTDNTSDVIEKYKNDMNKKVNIKLLHSEKGVSRARNLGIWNSSGKYLIFVDSDDIWLKGSFEKISNNIEEQDADLFLYSYIKGKSTDNFHDCKKIIHNENVNTFDSLDKKKSWMISMPTLRMQVWAKIFKSDIIKKENVYFLENLRYSEDSEFVIRYLKYCRNIYVSSKTIYKYTVSAGSVMRSTDDTRVNGYLESMMCSKEIIKDDNDLIKKSFMKYVSAHLNIILVHDVFDIKKKPLKNHTFINDCSKMKKVIKNDIFSESLKEMSIFDCFSVMYLPELFLKIHLGFFTAMLCYLKSYLNYRKEDK